MRTLMATLPLPPSANRYWRTTRNGRTYVSEDAIAYKRQIGLLLGHTRMTTGPVSVTMRFYRARKSGDLDNKIKVLLDSMNGVVYADDGQIVEIHAFRDDDKSDPRVEIEIRSK